MKTLFPDGVKLIEKGSPTQFLYLRITPPSAGLGFATLINPRAGQSTGSVPIAITLPYRVRAIFFSYVSDATVGTRGFYVRAWSNNALIQVALGGGTTQAASQTLFHGYGLGFGHSNTSTALLMETLMDEILSPDFTVEVVNSGTIGAADTFGNASFPNIYVLVELLTQVNEP